MHKPKIAIIGCGNVGMRYAYALMMRGSVREMVLIDADTKRAEGEAMDLSHGAPYVRPVHVYAGDLADVAGSDLVVITAGKKQKPGETRLDLVRNNAELFKTIIPPIAQHAPNSILLVVSNPVDILSYVAYKVSGFPASRVIGSGTVLDSARFRFALARHCNVDARNVHGYILGEHGDSEFAVWSKTMIGGMFLSEYCPVCTRAHTCNVEDELQGIFAEVRDSAYKIIERKGETSSGIGLAMTKITSAILHDENAILPVSSLMNGFLGINDVYISVPAIVNRNGIANVLPINLSDKEQELFKTSAAAIQNVIEQVF